MTVTLIPINDGYIKNFQIVGEGGKYDTRKCLFEQGYWTSNKISGDNCCVTNYFNETVNIKRGSYKDHQPNGDIYEYEFPKTDWTTFINNPDAGINSTRHFRAYENGNLTLNTETVEKKIKGNVVFNAKGHITGFSFVEVQ